MDLVLQEKIDEFINVLATDTRLIEIKRLKEELLNDQKLLNKIEKLHNNPYDQVLKQELFQNDNFKKYKELENEIYFLTLEMNQVLNKLTDGGRCFNENN